MQTFPPFYLMRHGQSVANVDVVVAGGSYETPLTEEGVRQAQAAGVYVRTMGVTKLFCSTLGRARKTAEGLGLDLQMVEDVRIKETSFGQYDGKPLTLWQASGLTVTKLFETPSLKIPGGGESVDDVFARGMAFIRECVQAGQVTLAVSHGTFIKMMLVQLYPEKYEELKKISVGNCEIYRVAPEGFERVYPAKL